MKAITPAYITLVIIIASVILNSIAISDGVESITERLESAPNEAGAASVYAEIYDDYAKLEKFIGITVSHEDLTNIEGDFFEILGAIEADDKESLIIAKSRLIGALGHLRRLSGINADSIF